MDARVRTSSNHRHIADTVGDPEAAVLAIDRERWIQKYAVRILNRYRHRQTPLGVATAYTTRLKADLIAFYDDPLKRMFVEASY